MPKMHQIGFRLKTLPDPLATGEKPLRHPRMILPRATGALGLRPRFSAHRASGCDLHNSLIFLILLRGLRKTLDLEQALRTLFFWSPPRKFE